MTPALILSFLTALFQSVPDLKKIWDDVISAYINSQIESMTAENKAAIRKAVYEQDQRDLEHAIGSPREGAASDIPGTSHRDNLPNVLSNGAKPPAD